MTCVHGFRIWLKYEAYFHVPKKKKINTSIKLITYYGLWQNMPNMAHHFLPTYPLYPQNC